MDKDDHLIPINEPAFCFFPTKEVTGLNFMIHAPFLLTDSREGIRAGVPHNDKMLQRLAILSADSLVYLRDISEEKNVRLMDLAEAIDVCPDYVRRMESETGIKNISLTTLYKISIVLDVRIDKFFEE